MSLEDLEMLKLYRVSNDAKEYWETWEESPRSRRFHWGALGTRGETRLVTSASDREAKKVFEQELESAFSKGYRPIAPHAHAVLMIEYSIDGMGTAADLDKRYELEKRMNETLGWTGLGTCDGGSTGGGTMEICNFVVDYDVAKAVIEQDLAATEFADFSRIYREGAE